MFDPSPSASLASFPFPSQQVDHSKTQLDRAVDRLSRETVRVSVPFSRPDRAILALKFSAPRGSYSFCKVSHKKKAAGGKLPESARVTVTNGTASQFTYYVFQDSCHDSVTGCRAAASHL